MISSAGSVRAVAAVRAGWGAALLLRPGPVLRAAGGADEERTVLVARVLGVRELAQAGVLLARPTPGVVRAGIGVDVLHAASAVALAVLDTSHRRVALRNAATATGWALLGVARSASRSW